VLLEGLGDEQYIMLDAMRRWLVKGESLPAWQEFAGWAKAQRWTLRRTMSHDGWVMDNNASHPNWRIEWGPAQRGFMSSHEFRVRLETPNLPDIQALVLDRPLLARLDREVYQQFTDTVQTRLDDETPEEMRWLAMHAKLTPTELGALRDRYGALSDEPEWFVPWLAGPVAAALKGLADKMPLEAVSAEPFTLRLARGQVVIRQSASKPKIDVLEACVQVAEAAQDAVDRAKPPGA
jgi:hypothetical protein